MATRHELIHIDFVANAGKANPVLKSLQQACDDARISKEKLDNELANAKAVGASAKVVSDIESRLKLQTRTWEALQKGVREYAKGIDTLSKGIKEFNQGTLDEMSAKFNKAVYNSAKLAQSAVKTGSKEWNELQRLMDATDRNVTRAKEDIVTMMQSLKDGSAVSTVQLTRARDVLQDLARLAVTNSEEWRGLQAQMNQVSAAVNTVAETERRLKGEVVTENDALALSNTLTKEAISLRHADGEAAMQSAKKEREGIESTMRGIQERITLRSKERDEIQDEIAHQEQLDDLIKERDRKVKDATARFNKATETRQEAQNTINEYEVQKQKVGTLSKEVSALEKERDKEAKTTEKETLAAGKHSEAVGKQEQKVRSLEAEVGNLEAKIKEINVEPIKPKVDDSEVDKLQEELAQLQNKLKESLTKVFGKDAVEKKSADEFDLKASLNRTARTGMSKWRPDSQIWKDRFDADSSTKEWVNGLAKTMGNDFEKNWVPQAKETIKNAMASFLGDDKSLEDLKQFKAEWDKVAQSFVNDPKTGKGYYMEAVSYIDDLIEKTVLLKDVEEKRNAVKNKQSEIDGLRKETVAAEKESEATKEQSERAKVLKKDISALKETIKLLKEERDKLSATQEKGAEAAKKDAEATAKEGEAVKMTAEEAKAALAKMSEKSTFKWNGGKLVASNLEEAENSLINIITKSGEDFNQVIKAFQNRYQIEDKKEARDIIKQLSAGGKGGLIESGFENSIGELAINVNEEKRTARINTLKELLAISKGVTTSTKEMTAADKEQEEQVKRLREAYMKEDEILKKRKEQYRKRIDEADSMFGAVEVNGKRTAKGKALDDAEEYRQKYVVGQEERTKKAWDDYQAAKTGEVKQNTQAVNENVDAKKQQALIDAQIKELEKSLSASEKELTEIEKQSTQAVKEKTQAEKESMDAEKQKAELLKQRAEMEANLVEKKKLLKKAEEELAQMTKESTAADKEKVSAAERLALKQEEFNNESAKLDSMKEGRDQAVKDRSKANRTINAAATEIDETKGRNYEAERKSDADVARMRERVKELTEEVAKETLAFEQNAQAIARLNKQETDAAIEMAQSENVSIEKVKQAIEVLQKKIQTEATDTETMQQRGEAINRLKERLTEMNAEVAKLSQPIANKLNEDFDKLNETEIRQGIEAAKELVKTYEMGSAEAKQLTDNIARADQYLREHSVEAARQAQKEAAQLELMTTRMDSLKNLSNSALTETKRFWQAMADGAERNDPKLKEIEQRLEHINAEEQERTKDDAFKKANKIVNDGYRTLDENSLRESINAAREYQKTLMVGGELYNMYTEDIAKAEKHLRDYSAEVERAKLNQEEMNNLMRKQLDQGEGLSESTLKAQEQYWQRLIDDPKTAAESLDIYKANLKEVQELQEKMKSSEVAQKAGIIQSGTSLNMYSESEITEAIKAAKELHSHMASASPEAQKLAESIANAEAHIKKYGIEAARTAKRQEEMDAMMQKQFQTMADGMGSWNTRPSMDAIKSQMNYWQRLIDDPKTAAESLQFYRDQLAEVKKMYDFMIKSNGEAALQWFQNGGDKDASGNQIKEMADKLKEYRGTLLKETNADEIAQIDAILQRIGASAKKATEELMDFEKAKELALQAGDDVYGKKNPAFLASPEEIQTATKSIEKYREELFKTIKQKKDMGEATDAEEAELQELAKYLKDLKFAQDNFNMSREKMETLMRTPTNATSLEELRAAIKRADGELKRMEASLGQNNAQYKAFAEQVRNAKNVMKEMEGQAKANATAWEKAWNRLKTYVVMYMGFNAVWNKIMGTIKDVYELSDKLGEVRKTTGFTADEVGRLSDNLSKMDTRTSLNGLMELSVAAGQLGLKTEEDVLGFTEAANMLTVALPEMGREAATEMMKVAIATGEVAKIQKQMNEGLIEGTSATAVALTKVGSTIDQLRANSAAAAPAITDFVKRVGAVGAQNGISLDQVAALGATVDAIGMRVEMSATALSRMLPAIKNNAYQIAAMIGRTEDYIIDKFENGMGMDVIIDIFESIRNNTKLMTGDVESDAANIEKAFEGAGLGEFMKELNQQGARAGIVFAGLSQNVDELKKNLDVASVAYEENIAIVNEYNKMNETTAGKLERLKNQVEEAFVSDTSQRFFGNLIDVLRWLVDFITGRVSPALKVLSISVKTFIAYWAVLKTGLGEGLFIKTVEGLKKMKDGLFGLVANTKECLALSKQLKIAQAELAAAQELSTQSLKKQKVAAIEAEMAQKGLNKAMIANVWMAVAAAIIYAVTALLSWESEVDAANRAIDDMNNKIDTEKEALDELFNRYNSAAGNLKARRVIMEEINSKYGTYLGFLLTDASNSELVALAHERITAALEEEIIQRERMAGISSIRQESSEDLMKKWSEFTEELREAGLTAEDIAKTRDDIMTFLNGLHYDANQGKTIFEKGTFEKIDEYLKMMGVDNPDVSSMDTEEVVALYVYKYLQENFKLSNGQLAGITGIGIEGLNSTSPRVKTDYWGSDFLSDYGRAYIKMIEKIGKFENMLTGELQNAEKNRTKNAQQMTGNLKKSAEEAVAVIKNVNSSKDQIAEAYQKLAGAVSGLRKIAEELANSGFIGKIMANSINLMIKGYSRNVDNNTLQNYLDRLKDRFKKLTPDDSGGGSSNSTSPTSRGRGAYGNYDKRVDPYEQWDAKALVKRRKEMLERVQALAGGADVQTVLARDKRFMDDATRKGIKNMRDAIAWYNTERLKIQEELHSRNLTNTGDWMDPKKSRTSKKKPKTPESEEAVAELDRYYEWRKEKIEEERSKEEMTEAEYNRRIDELEMEHLQKRSDLRKTFTAGNTKKEQEMVKQFRQWWASIEELNEVSWSTIEAEWKAAWERDKAYNDRAAQKDLTQMQAIIVKQLNAIEAIIDKERPFNGITKNLQENLSKMGILFKDGVDDKDFMKENTKRMTFLLKESENAYELTWEQLEQDMRDNGFGSWADAIIGRDHADREKRAIIAELHSVYDAVQDAIKKEASQVKKQVDIAWNDAILPNGMSIKQTYDKAISALGVTEGRVSRANQSINAGPVSERVADKIAIQQMRIQLTMQEHYYNLIREIGQRRIKDLEREAQLKREQGDLDAAEQLELDAKHAKMSLNLSLSKEQVELDKQREEIIARTEESQNRLYQELKAWAELFSSSLQSVFEASHAGDAEYYNEMAKMQLTGKGGPGAGTYIIIDNEGTEDATAHYEYLDQREALDRQREIERQNAQAEAWKKVMDDINQKISETITDQINAMLQNQSIDANTDAVTLNTTAINKLTDAITGTQGVVKGVPELLKRPEAKPVVEVEPAFGEYNGKTYDASGVEARRPNLWDEMETATESAKLWNSYAEQGIAANQQIKAAQDELGVTPSFAMTDEQVQAAIDKNNTMAQSEIDASKRVTEAKKANKQSEVAVETEGDHKEQQSKQSMFAKMTAAANLYGVAYQAMSNDNLDTAQKFEMIALQAAGQAAIAGLSVLIEEVTAKAAANTAQTASKDTAEHGSIIGPILTAISTAVLGGLLGMATSKIGKAKSQISQITGASMSAGRLSTGMLTYKDGNVNEFTDPASLTPGRMYNVDAADGKMYRARYMGRNPKTHITNGPEFHLAGEAGREAIIDAHTTRLMQMDDTGIWKSIQTLYNGGSISALRRSRRGRGVRAFADGNMDQFDDVSEMVDGGGMDLSAIQASLDRNSAVQEALLERLSQPIVARNIWTGPEGIPNMYNKMQKEAQRHGEKYL